MKRTDFYHKAQVTIDGVTTTELDFLWNTLSDFELKYEPSYYRIQGPDIKRLYLISHKVYDDVSFWWIIALVNDIDNPFADLEIGSLLVIPNILDVYEFQKKYRVRRTS